MAPDEPIPAPPAAAPATPPTVPAIDDAFDRVFTEFADAILAPLQAELEKLFPGQTGPAFDAARAKLAEVRTLVDAKAIVAALFAQFSQALMLGHSPIHHRATNLAG